MEQRLIDLDIAIKTAVHYEHPNMPKCLELLDELYQMPITPLMLKKQPDIVTTIRKLRKYIGPQTEPSDPKVFKLETKLNILNIRGINTKINKILFHLIFYSLGRRRMEN